MKGNEGDAASGESYSHEEQGVFGLRLLLPGGEGGGVHGFSAFIEQDHVVGGVLPRVAGIEHLRRHTSDVGLAVAHRTPPHAEAGSELPAELGAAPLEATKKLEAHLSEDFLNTNPDGSLVEIVELSDHPWFVGCQFHPELQSRPTRPHPLFTGFLAAAAARKRNALPERTSLGEAAD